MKKIKDSVSTFGRRAVRVVKRTPKAPQGRITNDTISEHRAHILTSGRRFKYPMQYARHKLVINTILLSAGVIVLLAAFGWWQLYLVQNTSNAFYRVTQALPLPVATIDGKPVRYSDYLMRYRSEIYWLTQNNQINTSTPDGARQAEYRKRQALEDAENVTYARSIASQKDIRISEDQINSFVEEARRANGISISTEAYYSAQADAYNWSREEVRDNIRNSLLKREVAFSIDQTAKQTADEVLKAATAANADFAAIAASYASQGKTNVTAVDSGSVPLESQDPNGLIKATRGLTAGQVTGLVRGVDGYYVAKLVEKTSSTIHYVAVKVALTEYNAQLATLRKDGKVTEFIKVDSDATASQNQ